MDNSSRDNAPPITGATPAALPPNVEAGFLDCLRAVGEYQDRTADRSQAIGRVAHYESWVPAHLSDLTADELGEARDLARQQRYSMADAADIVRRSRR